MRSLHPSRCETCKKPHLVIDGSLKHPNFFCCDEELPHETILVTAKRGCASHSDATVPELPEEVRNQLIEVDNFYHKAKDEVELKRAGE